MKNRTQKELTPEMLADLKARLPHGAIRKIAAHANITTEAVRQVFKGDYYNEKVIEKAIDLAKAKKDKIAKLTQRIAKVIN
jgi:N-acetyl-anhydromuramyl-L-alanine amidase AmpD